MPDLTIETYYHCASAEDFEMKVLGSKGQSYTVRYGRTPGGPCEHDWTCGCTGFRFHKRCKHIDKVKRDGNFCGWLQFIDGGEPKLKDGRKVCPKCGEPVRAARWAT